MEYIAEIGWNFMGDINLAEKMINAASISGATTAKFQYWNPSKLKSGPWDSDGRREIYESAKLSTKKIADLYRICQSNHVSFMVSAFNKEDAVFLSEISKESIKIPSHEVNNLELIKYALCNFSRVYLSMGACFENELDAVAELVKKERDKDANVVIMHCVSAYPCGVERMNLLRLDALRARFNNSLRLSDHSTSILVPSLAVMRGATVIEKHFTIDHDLPGRDNKFAVLPDEFKQLVSNCEDASKALIDHGVQAQDIEMDTINVYRGRWG